MLTAKKFLSFLRETTRLFFRLFFSPFFTDSGSEATDNFLSENKYFFLTKKNPAGHERTALFSRQLPVVQERGNWLCHRRKQFLPLINGTLVFDSQNLPLNLELQ